jgi:hypothetical protein
MQQVFDAIDRHIRRRKLADHFGGLEQSSLRVAPLDVTKSLFV